MEVRWSRDLEAELARMRGYERERLLRLDHAVTNGNFQRPGHGFHPESRLWDYYDGRVLELLVEAWFRL